ncbi:MAG: hypothetical protein VYC34_00295, partial [Planctomycetota bacterium]|nr:hypothetical protein [Planctomycetota bacterium]
AFRFAGDLEVNGIALWTGAAWTSFPTGGISGQSEIIRDASHVNGELWISGSFDEVDGVSVRNVAAYDGAAWRPVGPTGFTGSVRFPIRDLHVHAGAPHVVTTPPLTTIPMVLRYNERADQWTEPAPPGPRGLGRTLGEYNGNLIVGGIFNQLGATTDVFSNLASFNGAAWTDIGGGVRLDAEGVEQVAALIEWNSRLYVGGEFDHAGAEPIANLAAWNGACWADPAEEWVGPGARFGPVASLAEDGGALLIGAEYLDLNGDRCLGPFRWDGATLTRFAQGVFGDLDLPIRAFARFDGDLYVGGQFASAGGVAANNFARWTESLFSDPIEFPAGGEPTALIAADVIADSPQDTALDVLIGEQNPNGLRLLRNNGLDTLGNLILEDLGLVPGVDIAPDHLAVGDINGD